MPLADTSRNFAQMLSFDTKFKVADRLAVAESNRTILPLFKFTLHTPDTTRNIGPAAYYSEQLEKFRTQMTMDNLVFSRAETDFSTDLLLEEDARMARETEHTGQSWSALFKHALTQSLVKQYTNSINSYTAAIELNPTNPFLYINRSTTRAEMIDFINSIESSYQRIAVDADPANKLRATTTRTYDYDEAIADLNKAAKLIPELAYIYYNRANLLVASDKLPEAFDDYTRAIELNPYFGEAYYNRGLIQVYMKDTRKGYLDISKAGELGITEAYQWLNRHTLTQ
jgi:tetratricopeptide (TPR) repeat protein